MAGNTRVAVEATSGREQRVGLTSIKFALWLTVGNGSSFIYTLVTALTLLWWAHNPANTVKVLAGFSLYSLVYLAVQMVSALVRLLQKGGSVVHGMADIGISLFPFFCLLIIGTLMGSGAVARSWLTDYVMGVVLLTVIVDILGSVFYMRATQKTFETPEAAHAAH